MDSAADYCSIFQVEARGNFVCPMAERLDLDLNDINFPQEGFLTTFLRLLSLCLCSGHYKSGAGALPFYLDGRSIAEAQAGSMPTLSICPPRAKPGLMSICKFQEIPRPCWMEVDSLTR
jgi:hypothetical protein